MNIAQLRIGTLVSCLAILSLISLTLWNAPPEKHVVEVSKKLGDAEGWEGENGQGLSDYLLERLRDPQMGRIPPGIRQAELRFAQTLPHDEDPQARSASTYPAFQWQSRGPWHVGGMTRAMAIDIDNPNIILAGTNSGGIWRSTNMGQTWQETFPKPKNDGVTCLVQDPRAGQHNVWYAGSGDAWASASDPGAFYCGTGIRKSIDGGITWTTLSSTTAGSQITFDNAFDICYNLAARPNDTATFIYAACYAGILLSKNGGTTWTLVKGTSVSSSTTAFFTDVCVTPSGVVYLTLSSDGSASTRGIWRSSDGINFVNITPPNFPTVYDRIKIGYAPSDESQVYFLANSTTNFGVPDTNFVGNVEWNSLWKYHYLGGNGAGSNGSWQDRSQSLPTTGGPFDKYYAQGSYDMLVTVHPTDTNVVFIGGTNLYRSDNGFADASQNHFIGGYLPGTALPWVDSYVNHHPDQHQLWFVPGQGNRCISANDGGVFLTNDVTASPVVWTSLNQGYLTTMFYTVAIDHQATTPMIIGGTQDNGTWFVNNPSPQATWVHPNWGDGSYCYIANNNAYQIYSIQNGKIRRCITDANGQVSSFSRIDPIGAKGYRFINPFAVDPNNEDVFYLPAGQQMWRNSSLAGIPNNNTWDSITTNWSVFPDTLPFANGAITAVAVSKTPANILYYGTNSRRVYKVLNAHNSTARTEITGLTGVVFPSNATVSCIAVDPYDANKLLVTFSNYGVYSVFYSDNGGTSWKRVAGNLEAAANGSGNGPSIRWAKFAHKGDTTLYFLATSTGLYATNRLRTDVDSTVWVQQGTSTIGNTVCDMVDYRETDGTVVVATHGRGIFSANVNVVDGLAAAGVRDVQLEVRMAPNPVAFSGNIMWHCNVPGQTLLEIRDALGRLVRQQDMGWNAAGPHSTYWNRGNLAAGRYFLTIQHEGKAATTGLLIP